MSGTVRRAVDTLREVVHSVAPKSVSGEEAQLLVELFAEAERVVASGIARLTPRVIETGVYAEGRPRVGARLAGRGLGILGRRGPGPPGRSRTRRARAGPRPSFARRDALGA